MFPCVHIRSALTAVLALTAMTRVSGTVITFTGNVATDFPASDPGVFIATSSTPITFRGNRAGWQIDDVRYSYDFASDTAYFGT